MAIAIGIGNYVGRNKVSSYWKPLNKEIPATLLEDLYVAQVYSSDTGTVTPDLTMNNRWNCYGCHI